MNPFKKVEDFEDEINIFLRKHKTFLSDQGKRISDYFEMSCYNKLVKHYSGLGYKINVVNLISKKFKYKLSPSGYPENFSHFEICIDDKRRRTGLIVTFEIHHNLTIQSGYDENIFLTPDISVINKGTIISDYNHYLVANSTKKFCYVRNNDLQTFCEVKNFTPFPELLYSFIGLFNELKSKAIDNGLHNIAPSHLAPSLMISGKENEHTKRIKHSLESRFSINILFDLFERGSFYYDMTKEIFSMNTSSAKTIDESIMKHRVILDDELPF